MPVLVVDRVEVIDRISGGKLTTEYSYHHGYWDGAEREFRGFGRVEQTDTEVFEDYDWHGLHGEEIEFEHVDGEKYFSPPLLTKTWFHQGPVGDEFGGWEELDYSEEYWDGDSQMLERPQELQDFLKRLPRRVKRDALRTLRGQVLRTELYARDGTDRQNRPYTVTESIAGVREESELPTRNVPYSPEAPEPPRIFFPYGIGQRTTQWERGEEPMTQFSFTEDYDEYGQPRKQLAIACDRGWRNWDDARTDYLATYGESTLINRDEPQVAYLLGRVAKTSSYELKLGDTPMTVAQLKEAALKEGEEGLPRSLIAQSLTYYDGPAFEGLPFGQIGDYGVPVRSESLVLTTDILEAVHGEGQIPPYLLPEGSPNELAEYPQDFLDGLPFLAGYTYYGEGDELHAGGYWVTATQQWYDFQPAPPDISEPEDPNLPPRGLLKATRDPLGRDTRIEYDKYDLLPTLVIDPIGLTTKAEYDYRVMQPRLVTDLNGNRTEVTFTPQGLLASTAVMGKAGEAVGDTLETPGSWLEYDFFAFEKAGKPISVRTIQREHHVHETDVSPEERDQTLESIEYSDGFGRLLQTRSQAEEVLFGDAHFGNGVLPIDRGDEAGTKADVVGRYRTADQPVNVVVSGWQIYDNKGQVVEQYEPFYSQGWDYNPPTDKQMGQKVEMYYDPRGQVILTINPDGSPQRVIYGIPEDLDNPSEFRPTPWEAYTYDANDLAKVSSHPKEPTTSLENRAPESHYFTPSSIAIDALGRTIEAVARNGKNPDTEWYITRSTYDIRGNLLTVRDALGREAFRYTYDLADNPLRTENFDAGVQGTVLDAVGKPVEQRDSKDALILQDYDSLDRPSRMWARDGVEQALTLREQLEYGDGGTPEQSPEERQAAQGLNQLGQVVRYDDEAGRLISEAYDFKGNLLSKVRRVIADESILQVFENGAANNWEIQAFRVDWESADTQLEDQGYRTSMTYDALNRVKVMQYPEDVAGTQKELRPQYNRAGALESVQLDGTIYVERIAYNAKGQRTLIAYGNGIMTRYAYDPETFRLLRLRSERYTQPEPLTYRPTGAPLQDFAYEYDLVGNITAIRDRTPGSGVANSLDGADALNRSFTYDPLYRLLSATGRECQNIPQPRPWTDEPPCGFNSGNHGTPNQDNAPNLTSFYRETYTYDPAGNMTKLQHQQLVQRNGGQQWENTWSRNFGMGGLTPEAWSQEWPNHLNGEWEDAPGNKLTHLEDRRADNGNNLPVVPQTHFFDDNGNLIRENNSRHFEWDHSDQMRVFRTQTEGAEPTIYAHYLYDASGQRVKKLVRKQGGQVEVTVYIDGVFEHHRWQEEGETKQNNRLHVMDDQSRIALVRVGDVHRDDRGPAVQYHLGDHLGSSHLVVNGAGDWVNREEFTPYGETSFGSFGRKRYRFTGKERDEESGLNYHGARYYAPWLVRWVSPDPAGMVDGTNLFVYSVDNPVRFADLLGFQSTDQVVDTAPWEEIGNSGVYEVPGEIINIEGKAPEFDEFDLVGEKLLLETHDLINRIWEEPFTFDKFRKNGLVRFKARPSSARLDQQTEEFISDEFPEVYQDYIDAHRERRKRGKAAEIQAHREYNDRLYRGAYDFLSTAWEIEMFFLPIGAASKGLQLFTSSASKSSKVIKGAQRIKWLDDAALGQVWGAGKTKVAQNVSSANQRLIRSYELITKKIVVPPKSRGITDKLRKEIRDIAAEFGEKGKIDTSHITPHVFTKPGDTVLVRPQLRSINRAEGRDIARAAAARRKWNKAHPYLQLTVR